MKKILLGVALVLLLAIGGGAWWLYSSLNSLVASAIRTYGPEITDVPVKLASSVCSQTGGAVRHLLRPVWRRLYLSRMSSLTDFTPLTPRVTSTALIILAWE